jgi:RNA polymerase sigma-70 factor, ECF subfamily
VDQELVNRFRQMALPHLDEAYNLARWLTRNGHDAEDIVQEACLRGLRGFSNFRGDDARAWLLTIVRNTCYTWLKRQRSQKNVMDVEADIEAVESTGADPFSVLSRNIQSQQLRAAVEELPVEFREVVVLKDLQGLSYREISQIIAAPIGTVMSRLARGRRRLALRLCAGKEPR